MRAPATALAILAVLAVLGLSCPVPADAQPPKDAPLKIVEQTVIGQPMRNLERDIRRYFLRGDDEASYFLGNDTTLSLTFRLFLDEAVTAHRKITVTGKFNYYESGVRMLRGDQGYSYRYVEE